ncbi:DUF4215 domain-containing protein [Sorangium sp. So ce542]|uniref:DUF4215 domain-containing protein n=1 Tax=Sorangium sp. So ce542 TaxID=3133316 RepID=UPI003F6201D7
MNVRLVAGIFVLALSAAAGCGDDDGQGGAGGNGGSGGAGGAGGVDATSTGTGTGGGGGAEPTGTGGSGGEPTGTGGSGGEPTGTGGSGGEPTGTGGSGGSGGAEPTGTGGSGGAEPTGTGGSGGAEPTGTGGSGGAEPTGTGGSGGSGGAEPTGTGGSGGSGGAAPTGTGGSGGAEPTGTGGSGGAEPTGEADCTNYEDDDGDGSYDCADADCAATCAPIAEAACASATPVVSTTIHGDTSAGSSGLEGTCFLGNTGHGPEEIHLFTPPAGQSGMLVIELESPTDHSVYARSACADMFSEIDCSDESSPYEGLPDEERIEIYVRDGQAVPIVVDAYETLEAGPYTLNVNFTPIVCGDRTVDATEECDDGNTTSGDGCSATCVYETEVLCEDADELVVGENAGSTAAGTSVFEGSCIGWDLPEAIHRFTPPSGGTLTLTLSTEADLGFYVRGSCADSGSEIECADDGGRGDDETLAIDVTGGEPLFVVVDTYMPIGGGPYTLTVAFTPAP